MRPRDFQLRDGMALPALLRALAPLRDLVDALRGVRVRDQVRIVVDTVVDTAAMPLELALPGDATPLGIVLVRAMEQGSDDGHAISGGGVTWSPGGAGVLIHEIDSLAASTRYDATIAVLE